MIQTVMPECLRDMNPYLYRVLDAAPGDYDPYHDDSRPRRDRDNMLRAKRRLDNYFGPYRELWQWIVDTALCDATFAWGESLRRAERIGREQEASERMTRADMDFQVVI